MTAYYRKRADGVCVVASGLGTANTRLLGVENVHGLLHYGSVVALSYPVPQRRIIPKCEGRTVRGGTAAAGPCCTFTTATELVVVLQHPPPMTSRSLQHLQEHIWSLYDRLRDVRDSSLEVFQERLWRMTGSVGHGKRNILGDGLH